MTNQLIIYIYYGRDFLQAVYHEKCHFIDNKTVTELFKEIYRVLKLEYLQ